MKDTKIKEKNPKESFELLYIQAIELIKQKKLVLPEEVPASFFQFKKLSNAEQVKLIEELSMLENLPKVLLDLMKLKQFKLDELPNNLLKKIGNDESIGALMGANKKAHALLQPPRLLSAFQRNVAFGKQDKAAEIFSIWKHDKYKEERQKLLRTPGIITDYSGREFHCTAYEYAYWAMDTHMCRMLEKHMDADTKAEMLIRCEAIEANGLTYKQRGAVIEGSKHFDFTPLKNALKNYIDGYENWESTDNWTAMKAAWMQVGIAQRDVPVHVANEYCRKDRSFSPTPKFNEDKLPRELSFYNYRTGETFTWFPLVISDSSGLGVDFGFIRGLGSGGRLRGRAEWAA